MSVLLISKGSLMERKTKEKQGWPRKKTATEILIVFFNAYRMHK